LTIITEEQTYQRLGRYLSKECTREEAGKIEADALGNSECEALLAGLRRLWEAKEQDLQQWDADEGWQELEGLLGKQARSGIKAGPDEDETK
jgi:hypothetical protein